MTSKSAKAQQRQNSEVIGANLRRIRTMAGLSQERLGELLGVTFQQVQKYEKGSNRISAPVLVELSAILSVDIQDFFAGCSSTSRKVRGVKANPVPDATPRTIELAVRLNALPRGNAREGLFKLIDAIAAT